MFNLPVFQAVLAVYCALVIAKTILCYANIPVALWTIGQRISSNRCILWLAVMLVTIPGVCLILTPLLLVRERFSFFLAYSKFKVIREIATVI